MSFGELLTHAQVWPFSLLLLLFFAVSVLEIVMVFTGAGADLGLDLSVDIDVPTPDASLGLKVFDVLGIGRVPYLISIAAFLLCVGVIGGFAQTVQLELIGAALPWPFVMPAACLAALPPVRMINFALGRLWPKDVETSAVTAGSLIGHEAEVVLGTVGASDPGQIKFRDSEGAMHHGMAYADRPEESYAQGEIVLIVGRRGAFYTVIRHPNPSRPVSS